MDIEIRLARLHWLLVDAQERLWCLERVRAAAEDVAAVRLRMDVLALIQEMDLLQRVLVQRHGKAVAERLRRKRVAELGLRMARG